MSRANLNGSATPISGSPAVTAGLTSQEAAARLAQYGPNDPAPSKRRLALFEFLRLFLNPLVLILVIAAVVSIVLGQVTDAGIILAIVILSNTVDFAQTHKSQTAMEQLQLRVAPTATALRDGRWHEIPRAEVVPGDIVWLSAGDLVPADSRLLDSHSLCMQQAALTGESLPVEKQAEGDEVSTNPDTKNMVFLGTSVISGTAQALVVATGFRTSFGDIASRLASRPEQTAFDRGLKDFSLFLTRTVMFLVILLTIISLVRHQDPFQSLLFAVALAVGLTPEFLPMIVSVTLTKGARAMARKKVIVKHLSAIQNFGSIDVLCSDKTGTLTSGNMKLDQSVDPFGHPSERVLTLAYCNSKFETGIRSPLDIAILRIPEPADAKVYQKRYEIPYDFERRRLSVVVECDSRRFLVTKGAPEGILARSRSYELDGRTSPMDDSTLSRCHATYEYLSRQGFRVLGVAFAEVETRAAYSGDDERDLIFAGFLAFTDPPLPDASEAVAALKREGVQVKIITGDGDLVSRHVCSQVGLESGEVVLGDEIQKMTDEALAQVAADKTVFARVSPAQKQRILLALKHRGHVVGFMGDGINDAPSLHAADVGISVSSAVDVAREAADIILVEPGLSVLASGIMEGRKAFGNVMKYLLMGTSSNFGNMFSMAGASMFLPFLPMLPTQILLNNFLYDFSQITIPTDNVDDNFLRQPEQWDIGLIRKFMVSIGPISSLFDFLTFYVLLHSFHAAQTLFHTGWFMESLATQTLVIFVIRTTRSPLQSRPSLPLALTTVIIVAIGVVFALSPLGGPLGFVPLPRSYFVYLTSVTVIYLFAVELAKRLLIRKRCH